MKCLSNCWVKSYWFRSIFPLLPSFFFSHLQGAIRKRHCFEQKTSMVQVQPHLMMTSHHCLICSRTTWAILASELAVGLSRGPIFGTKWTVQNEHPWETWWVDRLLALTKHQIVRSKRILEETHSIPLWLGSRPWQIWKKSPGSVFSSMRRDSRLSYHLQMSVVRPV